MALPNAYAQYNNNKVMSAKPAELTLMLYEGTIKFGNQAITALDARDYEKTNYYIQKMQKIIDYLQQTLDMSYPVAQDFDRIYNYLNPRLVEANMLKDKEILEEVLVHIRAVRDTWKEVMRVNKEGGAQS